MIALIDLFIILTMQKTTNNVNPLDLIIPELYGSIKNKIVINI